MAGWTVIEGDAEHVEVEGPFDLLLADPPYGKPFHSWRGRGERIDGDSDQAKVDRILLRYWALLRPHRHGYIFGPQRAVLTARSAYSQLIWDKRYMVSGAAANIWSNAHEPISFYAHRRSSERNAGTLAARLRRGSVIQVKAPRGPALRLHPNMKPVRLWQYLIESSSLPGDRVIDLFSGSSTAGVACLLLGRQYVGIESDSMYAQRATALLSETEQALSQLRDL
jgi:DNA modification methylase